uniref:DNA-binding protein HEXBP-like n=1 Tax=Nicotiana tabacum TaxID=4097 RepID=A0A1S3YSN2_TOBAC|nr:PREDICTED: DNA-binding protein HEXBP-like [Nicotiana tabacum]
MGFQTPGVLPAQPVAVIQDYVGHLSLSALPAQSSSRALSGQGSSMPGPSTSYPGPRGSFQSPSPTPGSCLECGEFGHVWRQCPHCQGGPAQQRSQAASSAPIVTPLAQPARGGAQCEPAEVGRDRRRSRLGGEGSGSTCDVPSAPARMQMQREGHRCEV